LVTLNWVIVVRREIDHCTLNQKLKWKELAMGIARTTGKSERVGATRVTKDQSNPAENLQLATFGVSCIG